MHRSLMLSWISLSLVACTSEPTPLRQHLAECHLLSQGHVGRAVEGRFYMPTDCYRDCLSSATCEDLGAVLCGSSIALLRRCDEECAYHCDDGALIAIDDVCNGVPECSGSEDEADCPTRPCDDGTVVLESAWCDGLVDCFSGEDEASCATFSCTGSFGDFYGPWVLCDGTTQCADGSDEASCAQLTCQDGSTVRIRPDIDARCDGRWHCSDGSDEMGCAELTPMCT